MRVTSIESSFILMTFTAIVPGAYPAGEAKMCLRLIAETDATVCFTYLLV